MAYKTGQLAAKVVLRDPRNIEPFILVKQEPGSRNEYGEWVPGSINPFPDLKGSIQPLDGKSREELPEAERLKDAICVLFETTDHDQIAPLRIGTDQTDSDVIQYNGHDWYVRVVHDMATYGHLEVYATRNTTT